MVTASEAVTYPWTVQFDQILTKLASNPSMSAEQLGTTIVQTTGAYPGTGTPVDLALGVTRTSAYGNLAASLNAFAQAVTTSATTGDWSAMSRAEQQYAHKFENEFQGRTASGGTYPCPNDRDLSGFMKGVANLASTQAIKSAAQAVLTALGQAIVTVVTNVGAGGISTFLPQQGDSTPFGSPYLRLNTSQFDLFQGSGGTTPWYQFVTKLGQQASQTLSFGIDLGLSYRRKPRPSPFTPSPVPGRSARSPSIPPRRRPGSSSRPSRPEDRAIASRSPSRAAWGASHSGSTTRTASSSARSSLRPAPSSGWASTDSLPGPTTSGFPAPRATRPTR